MHLKRYTVASIAMIAAIGIYIHQMVTKEEYAIDLMGVHVTLPIAVWVMIPMILLFLASFFHMLYYGLKAYLRKKRVTKDIEKLADALYWDVLKAPRKHHYYDKRVRPVGVVLDGGCDDFTKIDKKQCHPHIRDAVDIITAIKHGEVVDLGKLKLDKSNPYVIRNTINYLRQEPNRAEEILRRSESHDPEVVREATRIFVETASDQQLEKYIDFIDRDVLFHLLDTLDNRDEKNRVSLPTIEKIVTNIGVNDCDYMILSKKLLKHYTPHELLAFFEKLVGEDEKAFKGYIFTLIEFEMLDKAQELLQDTQRGEYLDFKAYLDLRKNGKHYPIDLLLKQC
ncbi:hypothetical protein [Hydrogenimonas sp.]